MLPSSLWGACPSSSSRGLRHSSRLLVSGCTGQLAVPCCKRLSRNWLLCRQRSFRSAGARSALCRYHRAGVSVEGEARVNVRCSQPCQTFALTRFCPSMDAEACSAGDDFTIQCITNPGLSFKLDASTVSIHGTRKLKEAHNSHVILNLKHRVRQLCGCVQVLKASHQTDQQVLNPGVSGLPLHTPGCATTLLFLFFFTLGHSDAMHTQYLDRRVHGVCSSPVTKRGTCTWAGMTLSCWPTSKGPAR